MPTAPSRRLIENWLPINEISVEGIRERAGAVPNPAPHQLHVWWARRPLAPSRAAVAASLLPADADQNAFYDLMGTYAGVHYDAQRLAAASAAGVKADSGYANRRAFTHNPTPADADWFQQNLAVANPLVLDVTAGGGSIPFEAGRLGLNTIANELNPVAALILRATCQWPQQYGNALHAAYQEVSARFQERVRELLDGVYPPEKQPNPGEFPSEKNSRIDRLHRYVWAYLWSRSIECPSCQGIIPLSPNWRLDDKGTGVKLLPDLNTRTCSFEIVYTLAAQSKGTITQGIATCPYADCGISTPKGYIPAEAQAGQMGHILYCVIYRDQWQEYTKAGKPKARLTTRRGFRAATPEDDNTDDIRQYLAEQAETWERNNILPNEPVPKGNDKSPHNYGMTFWRDMFNSRQQLAHGYCVQAFRELVDADTAAGDLTEVRKIAWCYVAVALDKLISTNSLLCRWHSRRSVVAGTFDTHDFGVKRSYSEMAVTIEGLGLEWAVGEVGSIIEQLTEMVGHDVPVAASDELMSNPTAGSPYVATPSLLFEGPAQDLELASGSVDAIVFDPPYHNNVYYAELSDFFYVWLKRTAGYVFREYFTDHLTKKVTEAISSPVRFQGEADHVNQAALRKIDKTSADRLATEDYHAKMAAIFRECRRVIKPTGIMTVMFTHKSTDAWDALTIALIEAGFRITRTWPIKTEAENALNISGKAAARSTILLVCRPQERNRAPEPWHIVESRIAAAIRADIPRLQSYGLSPVDLYLAAFGPALQVISENWGAERAVANPSRPDNEFAVTPSDALEVARREVIAHRTREISERWADGAVDALTRFYILAQDGAGAAVIPFDEANLFARAMGVDLTGPEARRVLTKQGDKVTLKSAQDRMAENLISEQRPAQTLLDQAHTAIALTHRQGSAAAAEWLTMQGHQPQSPEFKGTLEALLRVARPNHPDLPPGSSLWQFLYADPTPRPQQGVLLAIADGTGDNAGAAAG